LTLDLINLIISKSKESTEKTVPSDLTIEHQEKVFTELEKQYQDSMRRKGSGRTGLGL
jgi:hypothetical protein